MNLPFAGNSFVHAFNVKTCFAEATKKMTATGISFSPLTFFLSLREYDPGGNCGNENDGYGVRNTLNACK